MSCRGVLISGSPQLGVPLTAFTTYYTTYKHLTIVDTISLANTSLLALVFRLMVERRIKSFLVGKDRLRKSFASPKMLRWIW